MGLFSNFEHNVYDISRNNIKEEYPIYFFRDATQVIMSWLEEESNPSNKTPRSWLTRTENIERGFEDEWE